MKRFLIFSLLSTGLTACGNSQPYSKTMTSSEEVKNLYTESGLPQSAKYAHDIQGLNTAPPQPLSKAVLQLPDPLPEQLPTVEVKVTEQKSKTPQKQYLKPLKAKKVAVDQVNESWNAKNPPWKDNRPVSPEEGQRLLAIYEQAWEHYRAAESGENQQHNWLKAAEYFTRASRFPANEQRKNCLYNAACSLSLANKKKEALKLLSLSIDFGFTDHDHIKNDKDLNNIRNTDGYRKLMAQLTGEDKAKASSQPDNKEKLIEQYRQGDALYDEKKFMEAAQAYLNSAKLPAYAKSAYYNAACCYALAGDTDKALGALKKSLDAGWNDLTHLQNDSDLDSLRNSEEYKKLIAQAFPNQTQKSKKPEGSKKTEGSGTQKAPLDREKIFSLYQEAEQLYHKKDYKKAAAKFTQSAQLHEIRKHAHYNAACCHALAGNKEKALKSLKMAMEAGWNDFEHMKTDSDLDSLRKSQEYQDLLKK